jgi:hypothetical protein
VGIPMANVSRFPQVRNTVLAMSWVDTSFPLNLDPHFPNSLPTLELDSVLP